MTKHEELLLWLSRICIIIGILGIAHHFMISGRLWDWGQLWHHEPLIAICFALGLGFLAGYILRD